MDAEQYKQAKLSIKQLKVDHYTDSYAVIALNFIMLYFGVKLFFSHQPLLYVAGAALWALQMNHAYLIVHECGHSTFVKRKRANERLGNLFALFALLPFYSRRLEHATHHRMPGSFQEPSTKRALERFKFIDPKAAFFISICWKLWIPIFALNEHIMLWTLPFQPNIPVKIKNAAIACGAGYAAIAAIVLLAAPHGGVVLLKFLLVIYAYMMLLEYFNLPHHLTSPIEDREGAVPYHEQALYSKSCSPLPYGLGKWLVLNFNYHIVHHLYPAVHWTMVPKAHEIMSSFDPSIGGTASEWEINTGLRKKTLREALAKYFDHQYKTSNTSKAA